MPGKSLFVIDQQQFLEKRKVGLESFMRKLVERQDVYANEVFLHFLNVIFQRKSNHSVQEARWGRRLKQHEDDRRGKS